MKHAKHFIAPQLETVADVGHDLTNNNADDSTLPSATAYSYAWSGYEVLPDAGNAFTKIAGDWGVPSVSSSTTKSYECSWVGLGGWNNTHLIQAGTESDWTGSSAKYYVWTEQLPDQPTEQMVSNFPVSPGDKMYVHIEYATHQDASGNTIGNATFYLENLTQNNYTSWFTSAVNAINDYYGGTAEWVDERPTVNGTPAPLANFKSVTWTNLFAATPNASKQLGDWDRGQFVMINSATPSVTLASPGADYDATSNSFTNYLV